MDPEIAPMYPLRFREVLRDYRFGNRWIVREFEKTHLPADHRVGETWEVCDRPGESSEIVNGPLAGRTLREAIDAHGADLLGGEIMDRFGGRFPLLIKLLDATHTLSEQVHTNDRLTAERFPEEFCGKTEAWYMLRTASDAKVYAGPRARVTRGQLVNAVLADRAAECMAEHAAKPGDAFLLYAGTMHYSPGGLLFYEIMQNSDVYTSLKPPRRAGTEAERIAAARSAVEAVHLEDGFDCRTHPVPLADGPNSRTFIFACQHFALERLDLAGPARVGAPPRRFEVLTVIEGHADITGNGHTERLAPGQSCLLPASLPDVTVTPAPTATVLRAYVPDLPRDIIAPLRAAGTPDDAIAALAGQTRLNPLVSLLAAGR